MVCASNGERPLEALALDDAALELAIVVDVAQDLARVRVGGDVEHVDDAPLDDAAPLW